MKLKLLRDKDSGNATIGRLYCEKEFLCYTLENTWMDNEPRVSCIPEGRYGMKTKTYGKYYKKYQLPIPILQDVPGRSEILIHPGNYAKDTLGCILVGDSKGEDAVWNSRNTWHNIYPYLSNATEIWIEAV